MHNPKPPIDLLDPLDDEDDRVDTADDLIEDIENKRDDDYGDETQANEERTAELGLDQDDFIDPRGEDEHEEDIEE